MPRVPGSPKILIYIKPWDDDVFRTYINLLEYIERIEKEQDICL